MAVNSSVVAVSNEGSLLYSSPSLWFLSHSKFMSVQQDLSSNLNRGLNSAHRHWQLSWSLPDAEIVTYSCSTVIANQSGHLLQPFIILMFIRMTKATTWIRWTKCSVQISQWSFGWISLTGWNDQPLCKPQLKNISFIPSLELQSPVCLNSFTSQM